MSKQTLKSVKVMFFYDKVFNLKDGERLEFGSTSYEYGYSWDSENSELKLKKFIDDMIESLKLVNCEVFQVAVFDVTSVLRKRIEFKNKGGEQIEIL